MMNELWTLKVEILGRGVLLSHAARRYLTNNGSVPLSLSDYATTSGIQVRLQQNVYVNAPFVETFCRRSAVTLDFDEDGLCLHWKGRRYPATAVPVPAYFKHRNRRGVHFTASIATHGDRARLSPIGGCSCSCHFCDSPRAHDYSCTPIDDMLEALDVALADPVLPAKHLLVSGGTPRPAEWGYLEDALQTICKSCPVPVGVMVAARKDMDFLSALKEWGATELAVNMELFGTEARVRFIHEKDVVGRDTYLRFIEHAVAIFGVGKVRSALLLGLESEDDTVAGVRELANIGCDPMLSPFRPSARTPLAHLPPPTIDEMIRIYERASRIAEDNGVVIGPRCIPCQHNTLAFPKGPEFYFN